MPLTKAQKDKYRQTKISGHLRTKAEGVDQGLTKPRQRHSWIGFPSVTISAAVAKDRVIMWHAVPTSWNGTAAEAVYKGPLLSAMRRTWGVQRKYQVVEDGDRKGFQSNKGKQAKVEAGIVSITLPPRTPSLMPLDYRVWQAVEERMDACTPHRAESKEAFLTRLEHCAKTLPKGLVKGAIAKFRGNLQAIVEAKGYHPRND